MADTRPAVASITQALGIRFIAKLMSCLIVGESSTTRIFGIIFSPISSVSLSEDRGNSVL